MPEKTYPADPSALTEADWKARLTPMEYRVLREQATERPGTGEYNVYKADGVYRCAACGQPLFESDDKYDSGSGWPSYVRPTNDDAVHTKTDTSAGMARTEVTCSRCGSHLGHVFDDGPAPTGQRWCINSASLDFTPANE